MPYNESLADRIREQLADKTELPVEEKKMFGGLCYMVDGKMCIGVNRDDLMARIDPDAWENALERPGCREMDFTGRSMKGYLFIDADGYTRPEELAHWVDLCLAFNPLAKASKKKK